MRPVALPCDRTPPEPTFVKRKRSSGPCAFVVIYPFFAVTRAFSSALGLGYPRPGGYFVRRPAHRPGLRHPPGVHAALWHHALLSPAIFSDRGNIPTFHIACRGRLFYGPVALPVAVVAAPCMTLQKVTAADPHGSSMVVH